jgi:two-component system, LytTR family, sensor kinase
LFTVFFCFCIKNFAQQQDGWSYQYYNTSHGLPSSEIIALAKDSKGFLWLGTGAGLSMYDGYSFQNHPYAKENELIGYVNVIKPDAANRLWIGSGAGLFCYTNNEIVKISATTALPQGVNDIAIDINGTIWLATENGPVKFNITDVDFTGKKKIMLVDHLLKQWNLKNEVIDKRRTVLIGKAADGTIYIAGQNTLFKLIDDKLEQVFDIADSRNKILSLFPVSKSTVYFDAASTEINKIENGVSSYSNPKKLYKPNTDNLPGTWYAGTRGAFYFHPQNGTTSDSIVFSDRYVVWATAVLKDDHFFWVASHDGLIKLKPSIFTAYDIEKKSSYNDCYSITELRNGQLLLGANFGKVFEKKGNSFTLYKDKLVKSAEIKNIYEDDRGWLWIASGYQGLVLMRNGKEERFTVENGLHDNSVYHFLKTSSGKFYVFGDQGTSEIIINPDKTVSFKQYHYQPNISQYAKFFSGIEAPDGSIWIGGEEGIVYLRNDSLRKFTFGGKQFSINFIIKDKEDNVWIAASGEGILQCVFNKKNELEIVRQFTEDDGLNTLHFLTLLADKENNIWAGSSKGLTFIGQNGKHKDRILNFDESDGFIKAGYSYIRLYEDSYSNIWAATTFGFLSFKPDQLLISNSSPAVYITHIREIKGSRTVKEFIGNNQFSYGNNSFNFSFTALGYANQENIRYYYKLNGLDTNWVNAGNQRSISFENLSPGNYNFRVKALNSKGIWSKADAVYAFSITSPFWKQWWFITLLLASVSAGIYYYVKRREKTIKEKEKQNTEIQKLKAGSYQYRFEMTQVINYFASSINEQKNIDDLLWDVAKNCIAKLGFEDCVIYLKNKERNILVQKAAWGPKTSYENKIVNPIEIEAGKGIVGSVAVSGTAEIINDTSLDRRYIMDDALRLSEISVPIINNGVVIGIIDSEHQQKNFYTERHLQILSTIASLCADKMDKIKAEQQAREKEVEVLRLNKDLATSQLTALRAQMNPHFIFNALNSVQQYILEGDVVEANRYLSKFSKLQREILHYSTQNFIPLEKEIEILDSYLQLEQLRFGESFKYVINTNEEVDPAEIKIPPMMMQPFVENAIWHGLMPKQGERNVEIRFDLLTDDILLATIRDNGIGRTASAKLKQHNGINAGQHESKGMSLVHERMMLLQQQYDKPFDASAADITDENGVVKGTEVVLKIFIGDKQL